MSKSDMVLAMCMKSNNGGNIAKRKNLGGLESTLRFTRSIPPLRSHALAHSELLQPYHQRLHQVVKFSLLGTFMRAPSNSVLDSSCNHGAAPQSPMI